MRTEYRVVQKHSPIHTSVNLVPQNNPRATGFQSLRRFLNFNHSLWKRRANILTGYFYRTSHVLMKEKCLYKRLLELCSYGKSAHVFWWLDLDSAMQKILCNYYYLASISCRFFSRCNYNLLKAYYALLIYIIISVEQWNILRHSAVDFVSF